MTLVTSDIHWEYIVKHIFLDLFHQMEGFRLWFCWFISPLYWLWRRLILFPSRHFLRLFFLLFLFIL